MDSHREQQVGNDERDDQNEEQSIPHGVEPRDLSLECVAHGLVVGGQVFGRQVQL